MSCAMARSLAKLTWPASVSLGFSFQNSKSFRKRPAVLWSVSTRTHTHAHARTRAHSPTTWPSGRKVKRTKKGHKCHLTLLALHGLDGHAVVAVVVVLRYGSLEVLQLLLHLLIDLGPRLLEARHGRVGQAC